MKIIDIAINNLSSQRNSIYFEHYFQHIKRACANEQEFNFVFKLLNLISINKEVTLKDIEKLAREENIQFTYLNTIDWLQLDGYLIFDDKQQFIFSSNLLFNWWKKNFTQTHNTALPKTASKAQRSKPK